MSRVAQKAPRSRKDVAAARRPWREHPKRWVAGCIDSSGAISAVASINMEMHDLSASRGKRWRWNIATQEMVLLCPRSVEEANHREMFELNAEEYFAVCDWLIRHGYADDGILPTAGLV